MQKNENQQELSALLESVIKIVGNAVSIIKDAPFCVTEKGGATDITTSSDLACQQYLMQELGALLPNSGFYCEEGDARERDKEFVWIIDPIDGTMNYSRGIAECGVSVALRKKEEVILGVVQSIFSPDVYSAVLGGGAYLNGKPISVSSNGFESSLLCTAMSLYKKDYAKICGDIIYETYMQCNDVRRFGSCAIELCYLAAGKCDLYFEIRVFPWDYAAAYLILSEAGGIVRGLGDKKLELNRPTVVVAANNAENYERLSRIVNKYLKKTPYEE